MAKAEAKPAADPKLAKPAKEPKPAVEKLVGGLALKTKLTFGSRDVEGKDTAYDTDKNNPRRGTAAEFFKKYRKGITIEQAIADGIPASKIATDLEKGYVKAAA